MPVKVRLNDPVHPKDETGDKGGAGAISAGQTLSTEQLSELSQQIGATIAGALNQAPANNPEPTQGQPIHQQLGMKDSEVARIREKLGEEESDVLFGVIGNAVSQSQQNDSKIVDALKNISETLSAQMSEHKSALEKISSQPQDTSHLWNVYGFQVFEDNKDDLKEALEFATEQSGGMVDYIADFEKAQENDDFQYLSKVKGVILEPYLQGKYKDHDSVGGGTGRTAGRADLKKEQEAEKEFDKLQAELDEAKAGRDHAKVLTITQKMKHALVQQEGDSQI